MKELTQDELRMNEQAEDVAAKAVGEPVEAAARCEQVTQDMRMEAAGVSGINRGIMKVMRAPARIFMPSTSSGLKKMQTGGLPKSFVLAATKQNVYALEDKHDGGQLVAGKVLKTWEREGFSAKKVSGRGPLASGAVPEDRQMLTIYLPIDSKNRYMKAANRQMDAYGSPGQPHQLALAQDAASDKLIDAVGSNGPAGANIMIGGQSLQDMMQQSAAQADPAQQLSQLADLHERGVLSDDEFAAQKAKLLGQG
jgi:Short C-terminal domain